MKRESEERKKGRDKWRKGRQEERIRGKVDRKRESEDRYARKRESEER